MERRILVVDDQPSVARRAVTLLKQRALFWSPPTRDGGKELLHEVTDPASIVWFRKPNTIGSREVTGDPVYEARYKIELGRLGR